ncbi:hypothetical protein SAMN02745166_00920 [Prosthecobacter debontii]|uniref:Uncharacterized protein n=1 Tax=Prosthecobacter debontii TaxID=48467 RepID=A0A1T4WZD1_9BACT|nr:heavy metal-associated domain-containing protein [Prosthecobacter debontii]SKA82517.1 hypothetical protein SAMN02745166_00920 [Prosthecobacter debontii]
MSTQPTPVDLKELDLVIFNMTEADAEKRVQAVLQQIGGIEAARIISEGAWVHYNPMRVSKETICEALAQAGFRTSLFQDSLSGEAKNVSQQ